MEIFTISSSELHAIIYLSNFIAVTNFQTTNITYRITVSNTLWSSLYKSAIRNLHQLNTLNDKRFQPSGKMKSTEYGSSSYLAVNTVLQYR